MANMAGPAAAPGPAAALQHDGRPSGDDALHVENLRGHRGHGGGPYSLVIPAGKCTILSGPSGSGKSLLLRMIADLDPNTGDVRLGATSRNAISGPAWRRQVIYVAADAGWWADDVSAHFDDFAHNRPEFDRLAHQLGLRPDILSAQVSQLSTGERQRLTLMRALARHPRFLLLDEPTSALDQDTTLAVEAVLRRVMAGGIGLLMVSHNPAQAARLRDAQYVMSSSGLKTLEMHSA